MVVLVALLAWLSAVLGLTGVVNASLRHRKRAKPGNQGFGISGSPGALRYWAVPYGITEITIDAYGSSGGGAYAEGTLPGTAGLGGRVQCKFAVTPNQVLGFRLGSYGDGGSGGFDQTGGKHGGTGGGLCEVLVAPYGDGDRIVAAGGGGGAGGGGTTGPNGGNGGSGGGNPGDGGDSGGSGGDGGTTVAVGAGGATEGEDGSGKDGGDGGNATNGGGGGGGGAGYFGGGGGGADNSVAGRRGAGGGGGSSYAAPACTDVVMTPGVNTISAVLEFIWT